MKIIKDLNIIIPLRDEENQIKLTIDLLNKELKNFKKNFIITLIDDYSRDGTWNLLEKIQSNRVAPFEIIEKHAE